MNVRLAVAAVAVLGVAGCKGTEGPQGSQGVPGASTTVASVDPGGACSNGGASVTSGGVTAYACNGAVGAKGDPGDAGAKGDPGVAGTMVFVASLDPGTACTYGGSAFSNGLATALACSGAPGSQGVKGDKGDPGIPGSPGAVALRHSGSPLTGCDLVTNGSIQTVRCGAAATVCGTGGAPTSRCASLPVECQPYCLDDIGGPLTAELGRFVLPGSGLVYFSINHWLACSFPGGSADQVFGSTGFSICLDPPTCSSQVGIGGENFQIPVGYHPGGSKYEFLEGPVVNFAAPVSLTGPANAIVRGYGSINGRGAQFNCFAIRQSGTPTPDPMMTFALLPSIQIETW